jgi:hypothetical protein
MSRSYRVRSFALLGAAAAIALGAFLVSNAATRRAEAQQEIFLDWADGPENCPDRFGLPPTCSTWHEVVPTFCNERHQTGYSDEDGNNLVSAGDYIFLDGARFRVTSAGPVVFLDCTRVIEPEGGVLPDDDRMIDVKWIEIYPENGRELGRLNIVSENGDGVLSACDFIKVGGINCHVTRIGCDMRVVEAPNATETETWGAVKGFFSALF